MKTNRFLSGHYGIIGKALGLGGRPYRSLVIREAMGEAVTVTVEFLVAQEQGGELAEAIDERKFFLVEARSPAPSPEA